MPTVTVITGLAGSGKTEFLNKMVGVECFDEGVRTDQPQKFGGNLQRFLDAIGSGRNCAIVEIAYLTQKARDELERVVGARYSETVFNWIFFENNPEAANWNCFNDPNRTQEQAEGSVWNNKRWTKLYEIPNGAAVQKIRKIPALKR